MRAQEEAISPSLRAAEMGGRRLLPHTTSAVLTPLRVGIARKKKMLPSTVLGSEAPLPPGGQVGNPQVNTHDPADRSRGQIQTLPECKLQSDGELKSYKQWVSFVPNQNDGTGPTGFK